MSKNLTATEEIAGIGLSIMCLVLAAFSFLAILAQSGLGGTSSRDIWVDRSAISIWVFILTASASAIPIISRKMKSFSHKGEDCSWKMASVLSVWALLSVSVAAEYFFLSAICYGLYVDAEKFSLIDYAFWSIAAIAAIFGIIILTRKWVGLFRII